MNKYKIWVRLSIIFQILTGLIHSLSFFNERAPANEQERQLDDLMGNYKMDLGLGFTPTMMDIMNSFSICFVLLLLFGGCVNWYLLRNKADTKLLKGVIGLNVIFFGLCFAAMAILTFLPPIICTGLIFVSLTLAFFTIPSKSGS